MAINQDKVNAACEELNAEGKAPTLAAVREALGEGSYSTLAKMVKVWRATAEATSTTPVTEEAPEEIREIAAKMAAGIWAEAVKLAETRLEADREKFEQERKEQAEELAEAYSQIEWFQTQTDKLRKSEEAIANAMQTMHEEMDRLKISLAEQVSKNETMKEHQAATIERLEAAIKGRKPATLKAPRKAPAKKPMKTEESDKQTKPLDL